jgi:hypothetical protein
MILSPSLGQAQVLSAFSPGQCLSCVGAVPTFAQTGAWPVANQAIYIPIRVTHPVVARKMVWVTGSGATSGNYDIGLLDAVGRKLASSGSTAVPAIETLVVFTLPTALRLEQQIVYLALALSSATCQYYGYRLTVDTQEMRTTGLVQEASAVPLPTTATFALLSGTVPVPHLLLQARTQSF